MLEVLGEALADGREFNLQPMGKLKLNRTKKTPNARIIVAKIRQSKRTGGGGMDPTRLQPPPSDARNRGAG